MHRTVVVWVVLLFVTYTAAQCNLDDTSTRLLPYIIPTSYKLNYTLPNPTSSIIEHSNSAAFSGNVDISLLINQTTTCIGIHALLLELSSVSLHLSSGSTFTPSAVKHTDSEITILMFPQPLTPQTATLSISFTGNFNNKTAMGFFLSDNTFNPSSLSLEKKQAAFAKYTSGEKKVNKESSPLELTAGKPKMYATQFEAIGARRAYPSFDEPEFKATFQLTATVVSDSTAETTNITVLTNTPLVSAVSGTGYTTWTFQPTPHPMSSYLLAIAVGEFEYIEAKNSAGGLFRIYTQPGASKYAAFALNVTTNIVAYFSQIWNFDFFDMLPKMDQISVPAINEDAMENWGLLTYYPGFLLVDATDPSTPLEAIQTVAQVVCHEIAHQWFGDTVTTPFWNQLFLNEGYARYLQYLGSDYLYPQWELFTTPGSNFYSFAYLPAMQADYMGFSSQLINVSQTSGAPAVANAAFGIIPYGKGACINRMLAEYITTDEWNKVMSYHLATHKYTNPSIFDLLNSYDAVLAKPMSSKFAPYFFYTGFPVVSITVTNNTAYFTQYPINKNGAYYNQPYWIFIDVVFTETSSGESFITRIEFETQTYTFSLPSTGTWTAYANPEFVTYTLPFYDRNSWNQINSKITSLTDYQVQYISDSQFLLLQMAFLDPLIVSATTRALSVPFLPMKDALPLYEGIFTNWFPTSELFRYNSTVYEQLTADLSTALNDIVLRVGLIPQKGEDANIAMLRGISLFWGSFYGSDEIVNSLLALYNKGVTLSDEQKKGVYWTVVSYDQLGYDSVLKTYNNTPASSPDKATLLFALSASPNSTQCLHTITIIMQDLKSVSDQLNALSNMLQYNPFCREAAWVSYTDVASAGLQSYGASLSTIVLSGFEGIFGSQEEKQMVTDFLSANAKYFTAEQISQAITQIDYNMNVVAIWG